MNPNKIKTFTCIRCHLKKEGHFNTKYCDECVATPYKCSCSTECTTMIKASGNRKKGFTFSRYADKPQFDGVIFRSGKAVISWNTNSKSIAVFDSLQEMLDIHGHNDDRYKSELVWHDLNEN